MEALNHAVRLLEEAARQAGSTIETLWPIWVHQHYLMALLHIVAWSGAAFLIVGVGAYLIWYARLDGHHVETAIGGSVMIVIALLIAAIVTAVATPRLLNPEYYASKDLIKTVRGTHSHSN